MLLLVCVTEHQVRLRLNATAGSRTFELTSPFPIQHSTPTDKHQEAAVATMAADLLDLIEQIEHILDHGHDGSELQLGILHFPCYIKYVRIRS